VLVQAQFITRSELRCKCQNGHMRTPSKNIVGTRVAKIRNTLGMSQERLAAKCQRAGWDIDRNTVAKIEGGSRCVVDSEIVTLSKVLEVSALALLGLK
jgi:hypothetical protein